jgi:nucleotide-binding universal stress UspA family protein
MSDLPKIPIFWAVDALSDDGDRQERTGQVARALGLGAHAVCVLPPGCDEARVLRRLQDLAPGLSHTILRHDDRTLSTAVQRLVHHVLSEEAKLVVAGTESGKGANSFLLGSFTESLILRSPIPVLVVGPKVKAPKAFRRVLFPTDMKDLSRRSLPKALELAGHLGVSLRLFHKIAGSWDRPAAERILGDWASAACRSGVRVDFEVLSEGRLLKDSILRRAQEGDLIALASDYSPGHSRTLGSLSRQIFDEAPVPVWVVHANAYSGGNKDG